MRRILLIGAALLTRTERYVPEFEWCSESWTSNVFRSCEYVFGRKFGIRKESSALSWFEDGKQHVVREFFTVEARLAHHEGVFRAYVRDFVRRLKSVRMYVPILITPTGQRVFVSPYLFAIAHDGAVATSAIAASPHTLAYAVTSGSVLVVTTTTGAVAEWALTATYNLSSMTRVVDAPGTIGTYTTSFWFHGTPASGTNNIVVTSVSSNGIYAQAYSGCSTSTPTGNTQVRNTTTSATISATSPSTNAWGLVSGGTDNTGTANGTNFVLLATLNSAQNFTGDSNTTTGTSGSYSQTVTSSGSQSWNLAQMFLDVPSAPSGPTNLKSLSGNLKANIKSISGNLLANIKSLAGNA